VWGGTEVAAYVRGERVPEDDLEHPRRRRSGSNLRLRDFKTREKYGC
jgi:hypothetical protein